MQPLNNRDKRACNRIRKRHAELMLLADNDESTSIGNNSNGIATTSTKKRHIERVMDQGDHQSGATSSTASINLIGIPPVEVLATNADHLLEEARSLSRQLRTKLAERYEPRPNEHAETESSEASGPRTRAPVSVQVKLQLDKLRGNSLSEREFAAFLHKMMLGSHNSNRVGSNWIRFEGRRKPMQIMVIRMNCEDPEMLHTDEAAQLIDNYFQRRWLPLSGSMRDRRKFWQAITTVVQSRHEMLIRKIKISGDPLLALRRDERKAQLLMSLEQMADAKYPFPTDSFGPEDGEPKSKEPRIRQTRQTYRRVTEKSPVFVLDCEMCFTSVDRLELTRISMVNEQGETLMDQLVMPHNKITNYITHKSGITEQILKNVTTRLKDVQKQFCALLTDDAILCGHSLENDLLALQLSHPFCIDTSLLFNFSGRPNIRSGLKALAKIFLDMDIQMDTKTGHCSLEDARATLKLLNLKMEKGIQFGNVALGWNFKEWANANGMSVTGTRLTNQNITEIFKREMRAEEEQVENAAELDQTGDTTATTTEMPGNDTSALESVGEAVEEKPLEEEKKEEEDKQEQQRSEDPGDGEAAKIGEEGITSEEDQFFDFAEAIRINNVMQKTAQLSDCFKLANAGKRCRKMLVAMEEPDEFFQANESCTLFDITNPQWSEQQPHPSTMNSNPPSTSAEGAEGVATKSQQAVPIQPLLPLPNLASICHRISTRLINFDFILIDLNWRRGMSKHQMDVAFKELVDGLCNNGIVFLVMSAGGRSGKDGKAIMYHKVHRK